ncbi:NADH dehydrogenase [Plesiocystis pacifica SIR-1]|uniref:NADH:ubiquinone reductase (non-electrogenic) n=1 Tax=Plesiocystis pacifica SIR-1 TaxID=391625 RepID=A6G6G6_9BACT|nr:NAD(P)/FAD-dependent oxidoreductase [Plesiocystis pacifica]EDM78595.1 NADH dehydrogenase [Plesiocystis pacifica SIR-1]
MTEAQGPTRKRVIIVGGGFAGLNAAKALGRAGRRGPGRELEVVLIDRRNHHLFQPLLYQVAMAGLSPADIAAPIRSLLSEYRNTRVIQGEVQAVDADARVVRGDFGELEYDYLVLAAGAMHAYFGNEAWEPHAPGLKTVEQATEIRRRVLTAFEQAETLDPTDGAGRKRLLTFVIVGGGPTGVELAGAIGEMSRTTLAKDFRTIDPKLTRVILIEAGDRILRGFDASLASRATRDLEGLGVQVWTGSRVTQVDADGVNVGEERIEAATVLWAAGVRAADFEDVAGAEQAVFERDRQNRIHVGADLSIEGHPEVFVAGDLARALGEDGQPLPGQAPVAMQQGRYVARMILGDLGGGEGAGREREPFRYVDKGQMATIGRSRAVVEAGKVRFGGLFAWWTWLLVHIYYLTGFRNRVLVLIQWAWSYMTFVRGARLIVSKRWRSYPEANGTGENERKDSAAA